MIFCLEGPQQNIESIFKPSRSVIFLTHEAAKPVTSAIDSTNRLRETTHELRGKTRHRLVLNDSVQRLDRSCAKNSDRI